MKFSQMSHSDPVKRLSEAAADAVGAYGAMRTTPGILFFVLMYFCIFICVYFRIDVLVY